MSSIFKLQLAIFAILPNNLGYAGYIKGVKSENVYGQTYGKTTFASAASDFHVGRDEPANLKYTTTMKSQFIDH